MHMHVLVSIHGACVACRVHVHAHTHPALLYRDEAPMHMHAYVYMHESQAGRISLTLLREAAARLAAGGLECNVPPQVASTP